MKVTQNNLKLFLMANNGIVEINGVKTILCHTQAGENALKRIVNGMAGVKKIEVRYFASREETWEAMKKSHPELVEWERELGITI